MRLQRFTKEKIEWIRPLDNNALFSHCAENKDEVTMAEYKEKVETLLFIHGITYITTTKQ